jgi:hypothetical protein
VAAAEARRRRASRSEPRGAAGLRRPTLSLNPPPPDTPAPAARRQTLLAEGAARLMLPVQVIRKTRSVGVVPVGQTIYEVLEDLAITVQNNLASSLPFCAFNVRGRVGRQGLGPGGRGAAVGWLRGSAAWRARAAGALRASAAARRA